MGKYNIRFEWCHKENQDKWCSKMLSYGLGFNLGIPACYNPRKKTICLGLECILNAWILYEDKEKVIDATIDSIRHEEDHRVIHEVTGSTRTSTHLDMLFTGIFNHIENREIFFNYPELDWFGMKMEEEYRHGRYEKRKTEAEKNIPLWAFN